MLYTCCSVCLDLSASRYLLGLFFHLLQICIKMLPFQWRLHWTSTENPNSLVQHSLAPFFDLFFIFSLSLVYRFCLLPPFRLYGPWGQVFLSVLFTTDLSTPGLYEQANNTRWMKEWLSSYMRFFWTFEQCVTWFRELFLNMLFLPIPHYLSVIFIIKNWASIFKFSRSLLTEWWLCFRHCVGCRKIL